MTLRWLFTVGFAAIVLQAAPTPPAVPADPLGRLNPQEAVTSFLEACQQHNYFKAAQYLDLSAIPSKQRPQEGPQLARDLESVLNSDSHFNAGLLTRDPKGNLQDDADPAIEHVANVTANGETTTLELLYVTPPKGPGIWLFAPRTVAELPKLVPIPSTESAIEARLPRFLVAITFLSTPLWKWFALVLLAVIIFALFRLIIRLLHATETRLQLRYKRLHGWSWLQAVLEPLLVLVAVTIFRIVEELINPSALGRLYVGRFLLMTVAWSIAWSIINLSDLFLSRLDVLLDPRQRVVSHSLIYLARRVVRVLVVAFAAIVVLDNWDIRMTTIIAGLGVGGIAIALAAQQTIANVFGGVSVIGDGPVMIGDFGNFGGVIGSVEEIGMRSARIRTLTRTVVSIPNASFAGMNLENYSVRDKILFNPTFTIKRSTPKDQVRKLMGSLRDMLAQTTQVEIGPSPVRISAYSAAAFSVELFAYVLTNDIDDYYKRQAELFLAVDEVVTSSGVELV